jgi:hypothetical protein
LRFVFESPLNTVCSFPILAFYFLLPKFGNG